jgi:hypothetical protein
LNLVTQTPPTNRNLLISIRLQTARGNLRTVLRSACFRTENRERDHDLRFDTISRATLTANSWRTQRDLEVSRGTRAHAIRGAVRGCALRHAGQLEREITQRIDACRFLGLKAVLVRIPK